MFCSITLQRNVNACFPIPFFSFDLHSCRIEGRLKLENELGLDIILHNDANRVGRTKFGNLLRMNEAGLR